MNIWKEKLKHWTNSRPDKIALIDEKVTFSYSQLLKLSDELAHLMGELNPGNNRVLIVLPRNAVSAALLISLLSLEFVPIFMDPKVTVHAIRKTINDVKPALFFGQSLTDSNGSFVFPSGFTISYQKYSYADEPAVPADLKWLLHTSGSTGESKAVMVSEENLLERTRQEIKDFRISSTDNLLNCLSFSHDLGLNQLLTSFYAGATLIIKTNAFGSIADYAERFSISGMTGTPLLWIDFLKNYESRKIIQGVRYLTISGGSMSRENIIELKKVFPETEIISTYGQTETYRTFINHEPLSGDLGQLVEGVSISLTEEGELLHSGNTAMLGYFPMKNTVPTVATKDLIEVIDGKYYFRGRKDDLIKRFEHRFHLNEIQHYFASFEGIKEAVIITLPTSPHDWKQHHLGVFLLLDRDKKLSNEEIQSRSHGQLPYFKTPDVIRILDDFPLTASFKPDRKHLELLLKEAVE